MTNFFHRLLNPHCLHCKEEREDKEHSEYVEYLRMEIARLINENQKLLNKILDGDKNTINNENENETLQSVPKMGHRYVPWNVRRQHYENESRAEAKRLADIKKENENIEKEIIEAKTSNE